VRSAGGSSAVIRQIVGSLPLFHGMSERSVLALCAACRLLRIDKGEILFFQQDTAEAAHVLRSGRISMLVSNADGRFLVLDDMQPGDLFGELGPLTRQPHSASALARADSETLVIPRAMFLNLIEDEAGFARRVLEITARRLHRSVQREQALAFMNAQARLARHLLALEEREHAKGYITTSQEDLANATGLIRQTVAKALSTWRRNRWLTTGRGRIVILNRKALEAVERGLPA
jgi:CRP-like cAMP-binding protein